jgi:hypothetical protein
MTFIRRLLALAFPDHSKAAPRTESEPSQGAIARVYRQWASGRALAVHQQPGIRVAGSLHGRQVVIDPGIDGPFPGWVQLTVAVSLPAAKPQLLTRATKATDFTTARIRALFDDPVLGRDLRAVSLNVRHLRLRLAPGASPEVIEHAIRLVGETLRAIHAAPESEPRHRSTSSPSSPSTPSSPSSLSSVTSINTTVPYPT